MSSADSTCNHAKGERMSELRVLTKSGYLKGLQCPKLLWYAYNGKDRFPPVDERTQALFDQGHQVGLLAQKLYPEGIAVEWEAQSGRPDEKAAELRALLKLRKPLFEPALLFERCSARADILEPSGRNAWNIVEVKSGTSVKNPNWDDLAFQRCCGQGAGLRIDRCVVLHIDNTYVREGDIDPTGLFLREDVTEAAEEKAKGIEDQIDDMLRVIGLPAPPEVDIGPQCRAPYECPLVPLCWKKVTEIENNIFTLTRIGAKAWPLYRDGIVSSDRIPPTFHLSKAQRIQLQAERDGKPRIDRAAVAGFLDGLEYPLHFLDFETFQTAIPLVDGTRPYQQIPFQFSLHVAQSLEGAPSRFSWLWDGKGDPRKEMLERLTPAIGESGSIVSYNAPFEISRLEECVAAHPEFASWWEKARERIVDLLAPFRSFAVYFPAQRGSASMKQVLPALSGKSYKDLAIQDGSQASEEFKRVTFGNATAQERREVRKNLEAYCGLDTLGMRDIVKALWTIAEPKTRS